MTIAGPTGSGKTTFVERFLTTLPDVMVPVPEKIIWCYSEWQSAYEKLNGFVDFVEGLPSVWESGPRRLIIIDDLMNQTDDRVTELFTKGSHHRNMSVIQIVQNLFDKKQRTINLNCHYTVLFKNPRDASQITHLAKQMYPGQVRFMQDAYKLATSQPFGYLVVDLKQETLDHLRLRSNIFPGEQQVVYVPK